ncbi:MAG: TrkH family potassium uptake protein [Thermodesulfobacteriota bacterium]|nr:TrkH family potassium uptake protein [Thermodesulfobacteriota bacterium]
MSFSTLLNLLGFLNLILAGTMVLPLLVNWIYGEPHARGFLLSIAATALSGLFMMLIFKRSHRELTHRDGFAIVALGWINAAFFGALPYLFTGALESLTDACFEAASGFTTTGSTIFTDIQKHPHGLLFWRSLTQWLGGMGIILLSLAILPFLGVGGMQLYRAEVPGPTADKLRPRIAQTARILWEVYVLFSAAEVLTLLLGGMNLFDALCHTFSTMATGGFSPKNQSIEFYQSPFLEYAITFFMFLAGANFALHYRFLKGNVKVLWRDTEFCFYISVVLLATFFISLNLWLNIQKEFYQAFRLAIFQVVSILTTTGFTTADFENWPIFSQYLLLILMFIGGCAGSTGGAIKCVRIYILLKQGFQELRKLVHPRAVLPVKMGGKVISPDTLSGIWGLFFLYLLIFSVASLALSMLGSDLLTSISAVATTLGNVGPGLGTVGPAENFAHLSIAAKWILIVCMLLGRLEIYTLLVLLIPEFWKK